SDLGHRPRFRASRARMADTGHADRLDRTDAHPLDRRLSGDGRRVMSKRPSMRTPLARVRYLGSAKSGTHHFWHSRVTSVALVPLTIAFVLIVAGLLGCNLAAAAQILGSPFVSIVMILFVLTSVYHMWLGMQEIIIDYVHSESKLTWLMLNTFFCFTIALCCIYAILKLSFGV